MKQARTLPLIKTVWRLQHTAVVAGNKKAGRFVMNRPAFQSMFNESVVAAR
jgi:hypothetical protein